MNNGTGIFKMDSAQNPTLEIAESLASIKDSLVARTSMPQENGISPQIVQVVAKQDEINEANMTFEYLTSGDMESVACTSYPMQIPVDTTNIHVDAAGVVYFNVATQEQQQQFLAANQENLQKSDESDMSLAPSNPPVEEGVAPVAASDGNVIEDGIISLDEQTEETVDDPSQLHVCPRCKAFFATSAYLKTHMKRKCIRSQNLGNQHACAYCPLSFKQRFQLTRHMMQHTGERPFKCEECEKTFLTKSHLKRHAVVHTPKDQLEHKCSHCDKVFAWASALDAHVKSHTGEKRFKCGICGRMFLHLNSLRSHMSNRHTVNGKYACVVCKSSFDEATELILHMKTHNEQESVKCERCYAYFTSLKDLETHICANFGGKPLICNICNLEFANTHDYCYHSCMLVNTNRACGCCKKVLKSLWHLREHLITHTGEKPFKCVQCLNTFRRKRELDIHMTRHSEGKPFTCTQCESSFTSENYLKQHMRKEHREKKFVCEICQHAFMHKCSLVNHKSFHERTGNKKFGKKYHRDDGLLVKELVEERLEIEKRLESELQPNDEESTITLPNIETSNDNTIQCNEEEEPLISSALNSGDRMDVDIRLKVSLNDAQYSNSNNSPSSISDKLYIHVTPNLKNEIDVASQKTVEVTPNTDFPQNVIEPSIELRNAEQDPSNVTTIYHTGEDGNLVVRCASCLQDFDCHGALLRHRKDFHNDGKPYQCEFCSRTFAVAANLSQHRNIHNVKRKYSCRHCGKSYKVTHKLREHLRLKHGENTSELTDLELQIQNSSAANNRTSPVPTDVSPTTLTDDIIRLSEFTPANNHNNPNDVYCINSIEVDDQKHLTTSTMVNPGMIQNIQTVETMTPQSSDDPKKMIPGIVFVDANGARTTGVGSENATAKRGDMTFLMNLSSLITELGDGLGGQRVIIQENAQGEQKTL